MKTQHQLGEAFRALHQRPGAFIIPNPWDAGTARILVALGFEALATTSAGLAFSMGKRDNTVSRDDVLAHCAALTAAVDVPVSADLGDCFGSEPQTVAETVRLAAATGLAGCSVEDMKGDYSIYDHALAAERVRAAADVAHALPFPFTLTARAENFLVGRRDLDDTIKRLQAYQEAGADVLYAPGLTTREEIAAVVTAVDRPVNVIAGIAGITLTFADLEALGVKRVSVGSTLARVAISAFLRASREMREHGTFTFGEGALSFREINAMFDPT
ncbi:MAG: isocitrate lyase/phosphoenolpyruvate mutase family protein [Dehalococcoidia bacterium]